MTSVPVDGDPTAAADARLDRLASAVSGIRRRGTFDLQRALLVGGSVLLPLGLVIILLGWYGASHTSYDFEQTDYLISGGILGATITVVGGFLYFGYWLTRLVQEGRRQRTELTALLQRLDDHLTANESPLRTAVAGNLVATATGVLVHRPDCALVAGRSGLRSVDPTVPGLKPCKVCQPLASE